MTDIKLKPCPFCGGEADLIEHPWGENWKVRCGNVACGVWPDTKYYKSMGDAAEAWNTRYEENEVKE